MPSHSKLSVIDKPVEEHHNTYEQSKKAHQSGDCHGTEPERAVKDLAPTPESSSESAGHLPRIPNEIILHIVRCGLEEEFLNLLS